MKTYLSIISLFILFVSIIILSGYQTEGSMSCSAPDIVVGKPNDGEKINSSNVDISFEVKSNGTSKIDKSSLSVKVVSSGGGVKDVKSSLSESCNLLVTDCNYNGSVSLGEDNYTLRIDVCDSGSRCSNKSVSFSVDLPEEVSISITSVQPEDGEVILYSSNTNIVVGVSGGEGVGVRVGNYIATQMGRGRYVVRGYPLKAGINEVEIVAESGNNRVTRKVRYENLRVIGDGRVKASEGGIVMAEFDKNIELRIRANSLDRDTEVKIKRWGVSTNNRLGVIAGGGIEVDLGGARLRSDAELRMRYIGELLDAGGSENGYLRIYRDGESVPVESQFENDEVVVGRISGGGRYYVMTEIQSNMGMRAVAGMGEVEPSEDLREGSEIRFPSEIKSMKRDGDGNVYILSGDKVYKYLPDGNTIKRILDLSGVQGGIGEPVSIGVTGDGRSLYVAYALGYIYRYDISGGVGAGVKVNAVDGAEEPRDGGLLKRTLFIMPRGLEILEATSEGVKMIVVDSGKRKVYMVEDGGVGEVWEVAGSGWSRGEDTDDPIDAKRVELDIPASGEVVVVNDRKVLFFADRLGHRVRAINLNSHTVNLYGIDLPPGYIMTVVGKKCNLPIFLKMFCGGYSGDGGKGRDALLKYPSYVSYDRDEEVLYIMDSGNKVVRALTKSGYITTIGGGGDEVDESKSAVMNKINQAGPLLFTRFRDVVNDENGYSIEIQRAGVYLDDGRMIRKIYHPIKTLLLTDEGTRVVKEGIIDWDDNDKIYKGNKLKLLIEYEKQRGMEDVDIKWDQVICRQSLKEKQVGGVFRSDLGCNKFGGDYISSYEYKIGNCSGWEKGLGGCLYEGDPIGDGNYRRIYIYGIRRDHPGKNRLFVRANIYGSEFFFRTVDIPYKLSENGLEISAGIQLGITEDVLDLNNEQDLNIRGIDFYNKYPKICDKSNNTVVDSCYFDTYGFMRSPHKEINEGLNKKKVCWYYISKEIDKYTGDYKIIKRCAYKNCWLYQDKYLCRFNRDYIETGFINDWVEDGSENDYSDGTYYMPEFNEDVLSVYINKLLDRMEKRGMHTIQITYEGTLSRACFSIGSDYNSCSEYDRSEKNNTLDATLYPIIAPQVPFETKDMIIDLILEKNETRKIIKNIFLKPSLMPELRTYRFDRKGGNGDVIPNKMLISTMNVGPLSKEMYNRISPIQPGYMENRRFGVWLASVSDVVDESFRNTNIGWDEILKKGDGEIKLSSDGKSLENLDETFFTGDIKTCGPIIKVGRIMGDKLDQFTVRLKSGETSPIKGCEDIKIAGLDCRAQEEKGIYNYYCFLRHAVDKGREILNNYSSVRNVYISISNDHVAPAIALSKVHVNGVDILTDLKNNCNGCKFTNAMVVEQLNYNEDNFWRYKNRPYIYENSNPSRTFDTLIRDYINHPTFEDTGFGVNAYAPGNCVNDNEKPYDRCNRFCYLYVGGNDVSKSYIDSIYCSNSFDCLRFMDDINKGKSRIFTKSVPVLFKYPAKNKLCQWLYEQNGNDNVDECRNSYIDIGQRVCVNSQSCKGNFYEIDPPLNNDNCASIFRCKNNYYDKYLSYIRDYYHGNIDKPLFISEIGAQSSEYSAYSQRLTFEWNNDLRRNINIYGITNIRDYQEQVDMVEGDVMVFLGSDTLRGGKKLKGVIIFSDDLLPESSQLLWYNFPPTGKPLDKFIPLLTGKGVR